MDPVSILIFNSLAKREAVSLPEVGTLRVTFRHAAKDGSGRIVPPHNRVEFLKNVHKGNDIVDMIAASSGKDRLAAEKVYRKWLGEQTVDGVLSIDGVGTIFNKLFTPAMQIGRVINPGGVNPVKIRKRGGTRIIRALMICVSLIAVAALAFAAVAFWNSPQKTRIGEKIENMIRKGGGQSKKLNEITGTDKTPGYDIDGGAADGYAAVQTEENRNGDTGETAPIEEPAATTEHPSTFNGEPSAEQSKPDELSGPFYYVVIGNFSADENAERFIVQCRTLDGSLSYGKLTLNNGKVMVYTSRSSSETEARNLRKLDSYPDAWVFKYRR